MLDANGDVRDGEVAQMFCESSMREVLLEINSDLPATSTFNRNFQDIPIDGVLFSLLLQFSYRQEDTLLSDKALVKTTDAFGSTSPINALLVCRPQSWDSFKHGV
jgi:hypothetical protein